MNLTQIRTRCQARFRDTNGDVYTSDEWDGYINDAYADAITASPAWPFLVALATDMRMGLSGEATLPEGAWRVTSVHCVSDGITLRPVEAPDDHLRLYPDPSVTGTPELYRVRANVLEVYPHPDAQRELRVEYVVHPDELLFASDEPVFPVPYHRLLVPGALSYAYEDDGNADMAALHRSRFEDGLARMHADLLTIQTEGFQGIPDTGW